MFSWWRRPGRGAGRGSRQVERALRRALLEVLEDDSDAAERSLTEIVRADSEEIPAYLALARLYRNRGELGRAIRLHQNLLLRPELDERQRLDALRGLAGDFQRGGFLQRAIAAWEEVLTRAPKERSALRALSRLCADVRDYERAITLARRLARQEGSSARQVESRLRVEMAEAARAEGRSDDARRALRRALRLDAKNAEAWVQLGALAVERGRTRKALEAWRKVPDLDRRRAEAVYDRLQTAYAAEGRPQEYEEFLKARLDEHPEDAGARLALARALGQRGETDAAAAEARRVLERDPDHLQAHAVLARLLHTGGRESEALKGLEELLDALDRRGLLEPRDTLA